MRGELVTHRQLLTQVWGAEYTGSPQYLHVLINHLRRKISWTRSGPAIS